MRIFYRVFVLSVLLGSFAAPDNGQAEVLKNEIGLYTNLSADHASTSIDIEPNVPFDVYLMVTNPYNEEFTPEDCSEPIGRPIDLINAFQYRMQQPETGFYILSAIPNGVLDAMAVDPPDYGVLLSDTIAVPENRIVLLMTFTFMVTDADPRYLYLQQADETSFSTLAVYDVDEQVYIPGCPRQHTQEVYPVSGDSLQPVFGINASVVALQNESWGGVKALFR